MIHPDFQNVRSFDDFRRVSLPWPHTANDRARFWNMLVRMNENRMGRNDLSIHSATFSDRDFNVSYGSYFGSVSKITKMFRYIMQNRRLRINGSARRDIQRDVQVVTYTLAAGQGVVELLDTWNPSGLVPYTGRGLSAPRRPRAAANQAPRANVQTQARAVAPASNLAADGWADNGDCNCEECRMVRRNDYTLRQQERERNASIASLLDGFMPFDNLSANVMAILMMEATA